MKKRTKIGIALLLVIAVLFGVSAVYVLDYSHMDSTAEACMADGVEGVTISKDADGNTVFMPDEPKAGLVFYPGGKVEEGAYAPLLCRLAQKGICCVLLPVPFRLAILDVNAADGVIEQFPDITNWYLGGHSLGGVVAAMYLQDHLDDYEGIVMLASYPSVDLSETEEALLCVYGENDGVMDRDEYEESESNMPQDTTEICISGGNHAGFGNYGEQDGDKTATISAAEQQEITADAIAEWMGIQ